MATSNDAAVNVGGGWRMFACVVLLVAGIMRIFDGIWAFRYHGVLPDNLEGALFGRSLSTYGWLWLIVGVVMLVAAFGVLQRGQAARWIGVFAGVVIAVSAATWLPYYPVWSLVYIALGIGVILALVEHGGRAPR